MNASPTARYKAEYGRSNGGVMNIVTKSGTNQFNGSWFTLFRDAGLNARTETERLSEVEKQDYRRYQYGGSFGGPIVKDKVHFFVAAERTQQDTFQVVNTQGLFPSLDGVFSTPYRENLVTAKGTVAMTASQYCPFDTVATERSALRRGWRTPPSFGAIARRVQLDTANPFGAPSG